MAIPDVSVFTAIVDSYLPEPQATLLNGIVFGQSIKDQFELYDIVKRTGLLHLVVLSGMNITILSVLILKATARFSRVISFMILTIFIAIFVVIVHPQAPIIRAVIMCYLTLVAFVFQRSIQPIVALFVSAITIGIIWPQWITSLSFLLSFFSTLGIVLFVTRNKKSDAVSSQIAHFALTDLKTSVSAQIMTVPLIVLYFRQISFIAPIATLLVGPFIGPLMLLTFAMVIVGSVNWYLGLPFGLICYGITTGVLIIIELLSKIPFIFVAF